MTRKPEVHKSMRKRRAPGWVVPALLMGLLAAGLYGYDEHTQKSASLAALETQYQGAFHGAVFDADEAGEALSRAGATTGAGMAARQLHLAGLHAAAAQAELARLPAYLGGDNSGRLREYFGYVRDEADRLASAHLDGTGYSGRERAAVRRLAAGTARVTAGLRAVQGEALARGVRLSAIGSARARAAQDTPFARRFGELENTAALLTPAGAAQSAAQKPPGQGLTQEQAIGRAREFAGVPPSTAAAASILGPGYDYRGYLVTLGSGPDGRPRAHVAVLKDGGGVLWMARESAPGAPRADVAQGASIARAFLARNGFQRLQLLREDRYGDKAAYVFCPVAAGVWLQDQPVFAKVSLSEQRVVGYDGAAYLLGGLPRVALRPAISAAAARRAVSPEIRVAKSRLAVTAVDGRPRLVYELLGQSAGGAFQIDVDAQTGAVLSVARANRPGGLAAL